MTEPLTDQPITATCTTCGQPCGWVDCPTGGWWAHQVHPADGHDAAADETDLRELIARLRAELEQAREARLEWSRIGDHPELAHWADALVGADLTPHPAFAWNSTTTGYEVAAQIATTDQLTDTARQQLLTELQAAFTETVCRVLGRSSVAPADPCRAEPVHQTGCPGGGGQ